jgi:hypothetical protein
MDTQGAVNVDWGFEAPTDGWYFMTFLGDIKELKKEVDGDIKVSLQIPLQATSSYSGEEASFRLSIFIPLNAETDQEIGFAKKKMAAVLANAGLWEKFEKQYPGNDISILDKRIVEGLKLKLPDQQVLAKVETKESKKDKKKYTNIVFLAKRDFKPESIPDKKAAKSSAPPIPPAPPTPPSATDTKEAASGTSEGW